MSMSERIADEIAGVVVGLALAGLSWLLVNWLWPDMALPAFILFALSWIFISISTTKLRRHDGFVQTSASGWKFVKTAHFRKYGVHPKELIWGNVATILLGSVVGLLVGGLAGQISSPARWPVSIVVFLFWTIVVMAAALDDWREK